MAAKGSAETFDVIVLGGGLAGYCAAVEAADHGAHVVLLERETRNGGATVLSGGSFAFAGTDLQARLGHESAQTLFDDLRRVGGYKNDEALVRTYAARQLDAYRWLGQLGVTFERLFIASGQSVPRAHSRNAREVLDMVVAAAAQRGVETRMSARGPQADPDAVTGAGDRRRGRKRYGPRIQHPGTPRRRHRHLRGFSAQ